MGATYPRIDLSQRSSGEIKRWGVAKGNAEGLVKVLLRRLDALLYLSGTRDAHHGENVNLTIEGGNPVQKESSAVDGRSHREGSRGESG